MDAERLQRIQDLFHMALGRPVEARAAFLESASGGDRELREAVERYLRANVEADGRCLSRSEAPAGN